MQPRHQLVDCRAATLRQSASQSRGKRKVMSASPMRRSSRHMPELPTPWREQRARKCSGACVLVDQILALVRRAVAEGAQRSSPAGPAAGVAARDSADRSSCTRSVGRQRRRAGRDGDEQPVVRVGAARRASACAPDRAASATATDRRGRRAPACRAALHRHADRGRLDVEGDAGDHDRQRRRVERDRRVRPARPQHVGDVAGGQQR